MRSSTQIATPVRAHHASDKNLAEAILNRFRLDQQVPDDFVMASVENGWVELTGEVDWKYERDAAEDAVKEIPGVNGITNRITIKRRTAKPVEIRAKIEEALKRAAEREAADISVVVRGTHAVLSGSVRSLAELREIRNAVATTPGIAVVEDTGVKVAT